MLSRWIGVHRDKNLHMALSALALDVRGRVFIVGGDQMPLDLSRQENQHGD